jgi:hypothetical protein
MEPQTGNEQSDKQFWKEHVLRAQKFSGSDLEYCRQNNLKPTSFSGYKKRMGLSKPRRTRKSIKSTKSGFSKIIFSENHVPDQSLKPLRKSLPDPKWTAEIINYLYLLSYK